MPNSSALHLFVMSVCNIDVLWPKGGRIQMKLSMQVGFGPGHIVLDGDPAPPPPKGDTTHFSAYICCGQMAGSIKMALGMEVGLGPDHIVL